MRRIVIVIVVLVLIGAAYLFGVNSGAASTGRSTGSVPAGTPTADIKLPSQKASREVVAEAAVMPIKFAELNLPTNGIVSEVLVAEGDKVKKEQPLARVEAKRQQAAVNQAEATLARARSTRASAEASLAKAQAMLAQLKAGPRPEDIATAAAAVRVAEAELAKVQAGADTAALANAKANMEKAARAVQQAQAAYDRVKDTPFGNIGPEALRLEQATIDYENAKVQYEQLALGPREVDVNVVKARLAQAQAALAQAKAGARPEQIAAAEADVAAAEAQIKSVDADVASADAAFAQAKAALADTEIRAPFDGTIVTVNVKQGEPVPVGNFAVRVADLSGWRIETKDLTELSLGRLKVGSPAEIKFDAIPDLKLTGKVSRIDEYGRNRQGDIVYTVVIVPDQLDERIRWNMTASVTIKPQ